MLQRRREAFWGIFYHVWKHSSIFFSILKIIQDIAIDCDVDDAEKSQSKKKLQADKIREDPISHSQVIIYLLAYPFLTLF